MVKILKPYIGGEFIDSKAKEFSDIYNPSTGEVIAKTPICPIEEVEYAIKCAKEAFPGWADTPALKRVQVLYKFQSAISSHLDELAELLSYEEGKVLEEARGDVLKAKEAVEVACGAPSLMMGESILNTSKGIDTVMYRYPLGVFASIIPFNFPAMIPIQLMAMCIATGNTVVIKASTTTPMTGLRLMELLNECDLPKGVVNMFTCSRKENDYILKHNDIKGVSFIGSTPVGRYIYTTAAAHDKRVQCMAGAKNHALVLEDCDIENSAKVVAGAAFGCAGERCMALPVACVQESIADEFVKLVVEYASNLKIGPAYDPKSELGPVVTGAHKKKVISWIDKGVGEGAALLLDGRNTVIKGYENGFYVGPTIFDHVTQDMSIGRDEIFGPVLCIKRVKDFDEGMAICNGSEYANGMAVFTNSGYYSRKFTVMSDSGQVGINIPIPVSPAIFPFTGQKKSFFGDLHSLGKDCLRFYTEYKTVTTRWFDSEEHKNIDFGTWGGVLTEK